jgi:hypothetical protein
MNTDMKFSQVAIGASTALFAVLLLAAASSDEAQQRYRKAAALPTPRTATGKPDFSGYWVDAQRVYAAHITASAVSSGGYTTKPIAGPEIEEHRGNISGVAQRLANADLRPIYKLPQDAAKARKNFEDVNFVDPGWGCQVQGVPRIGPPTEIVQTKSTLYFFYQTHNIYRVIPIDGRPHDPDAERLPMGDSIGRFEGNVLVVDVTNLPDNDETWIDGDGSFHSGDLHVVERFTRTGNTLRYVVTMDDPLFARPFTPQERSFVLGDARAHAGEDYPCLDLSRDHMVTKERH